MSPVVRIMSRGMRILVSKMSTYKELSRRGPVLFVPSIIGKELTVLEADKVKAVARKWTPTAKEGVIVVEPIPKLPAAIVPRAEVLISHLC
jgi:hypothetical protein